MSGANPYMGGAGRGGPAGKSKAEQKKARIAARLAEQKRKLIKSGIKTDEDLISNALKTSSNTHTFRSSDFWKDKRDSVIEEIDEEYEGAPVSRDTMIKIIRKVAERHTDELIASVDSDFTPSMAEIWETMIREREEGEPRYIAGDWVEFLDDDLTWKLGKVMRAAFRGTEDFGQVGEMLSFNEDKEGGGNDGDGDEEDITYLYRVSGTKKAVSEENLRVSEEGLVRMFGFGPWIWQQFTLIKLEQSLRIQEGHQNDFETFDAVAFAEIKWNEWLFSESNTAFRRQFKSRLISEYCRFALKDHILKPFQIVQKIAFNAPGWDVSESNEFGVFTYTSHFGTGLAIPLIVCAIQWMIPVLLVINSVNNGPDIGDLTNITEVADYIFCVSDEEASKKLKLLTTCMVLCIQLLYTTKVVVDRLVSFLTSLGVDLEFGTYNVFYRFGALRTLVREQRKESVGQSLGYTLDLLMNTFYICFLYMVNIFNILQAAAPFEVLLNALALEFVGQIDEEFASSKWWDPDRRWMKAAGIKLALQAHIDRATLKSRMLFSEKFNLDKKIIKGIGLGDIGKTFLKNTELAEVDAQNYRYMTTEERLRFDLAELALESENELAISQYYNNPDYFGTVDRIVLSPFVELRGVFKQYVDYRTWSLWDRVLYVADVPNLEGKAGKKGSPAIFHKGKIRERWERVIPERGKPFRNYYGSQSVGLKAITQILSTITFFELGGKIADSISSGNYSDAFFWLYDAIFEWMSYVIQIIFPMYNFLGFLYGFKCIIDLYHEEDDSSA